MREPSTCPVCSGQAVPVVYGFPTPDTIAAAERGEIVIGGNNSRDNAPIWWCEECGCEFGNA